MDYIETYLEEIEAIKKTKSIKSLGIGTVLGKQDFCLTFNNKNLNVLAANKNKIKHESVETAIIDNADTANEIIKKIDDLVKKYLTE